MSVRVYPRYISQWECSWHCTTRVYQVYVSTGILLECNSRVYQVYYLMGMLLSCTRWVYQVYHPMGMLLSCTTRVYCRNMYNKDMYTWVCYGCVYYWLWVGNMTVGNTCSRITSRNIYIKTCTRDIVHRCILLTRIPAIVQECGMLGHPTVHALWVVCMEYI